MHLMQLSLYCEGNQVAGSRNVASFGQQLDGFTVNLTDSSGNSFWKDLQDTAAVRVTVQGLRAVTTVSSSFELPVEGRPLQLPPLEVTATSNRQALLKLELLKVGAVLCCVVLRGSCNVPSLLNCCSRIFGCCSQ